ncbi:acyl-CoA N-acyltransferase [Xylogone sp. PMI_703]|nr:acyl-CoA N-acyltransferase [Xylogone sp. PMI_703]
MDSQKSALPLNGTAGLGSTLRLEPATLEDIPAITELWYLAFAEMMSAFFPDTPGVRKWWDEANTSDMINKPYQKYMKVVDTASDGKLIAYAKWDFATVEERGPRFPPWHEDMPGEKVTNFFAGLETERKRLVGHGKNCYLDMLCTHPDYRRRGAGSMLVQWGCEEADRKGIPAYIDASKDGAKLYKKFGFIDQSDPKNTSEGIASMVRYVRN